MKKYKIGVSILSEFQAFLSVGIKAITSIDIMIITDRVGSFVASQGIMPSSARIRK